MQGHTERGEDMRTARRTRITQEHTRPPETWPWWPQAETDPPVPADPHLATPITGSLVRESTPYCRHTLGTALRGHCQEPLIQLDEYLPASPLEQRFVKTTVTDLPGPGHNCRRPVIEVRGDQG